ncbi:MAG: AAA family ATPase [Planctomycetota bacterium]|jgi:lon-related putative ATP-dependent protease
MPHSPQPLPPEALRCRCDPELLPFETTAELEELKTMVGQDRAIEAVHLGTGLDQPGYNLFVLGSPGTGRHRFVHTYLEEKARQAPAPADRCYVNNFADPRKPRTLELPAGWGSMLRHDLAQLVEEAGAAMRKVFESEDYRTRRDAVEREVREKQAQALEEVRRHAQERGVDIIETPSGFGIVPVKEGEAISPDEFESLSDEERQRLAQATEEMGEELKEKLRRMPTTSLRMRERIRRLDHDVAVFAIGNLIDQLLHKYQRFPDVVAHLRDLQADIVENIDLFRRPAEGEEFSLNQLLTGQMLPEPLQELRTRKRYDVNVIVDHSASLGAPVVFEEEPTYPYLMGQIEHVSHMGALMTDFTLIRAGALHRANGGYLVLDVRKLLSHPYAYEALKQALRSREIRVRSLGQAYGLVSTVSLEPQPIPLSAKVVLIGDPLPYYILQAFDPEFGDLFKVVADFEHDMERSGENVKQLARLAATVTRRHGLMALDRAAVARLIEESARQAGDAERLSAETRWVADLVREAHFWASEAKKEVIGAEDVQRAVESQRYRMGRIRDRLQHEILRDTILINTDGEQVGQVNGIAIAPIGDFSFGHPIRITARLSVGAGKVIDIEREVELGGPIHSKGVLILSSFLRSSYVTEQPLSLSASLVFEQCYEGVEGDSASLAELSALLSAIAEAPIRQFMAVTGSVDQHGRVQAVGGVNEKIEGFFEVCQARGLSGDQGVVIPKANVKHLMLRDEVVDAVREGRFHVYPVETVHECMAILAGGETGERGAEGQFPEGTLNRKIADRLVELAASRRAFETEGNEEGEEEEE